MSAEKDIKHDVKDPASKSAADPSSTIASGDRVHGEGNYEATRDYNRDTKAFVDAGKVDEAARKAAPKDGAEAKAMERAEAEGAARSKD